MEIEAEETWWRISKHLDILEKDGILVLPDFFPKEQFDEIENEIMRLTPDGRPLIMILKSFQSGKRIFPNILRL